MTHRLRSFIIVAASYLLALLAGAAVFALLPQWGPLPRLAAADAAATLVIWVLSLPLRNASLYDPYWSVAPALLLAGLALYTGGWSGPAVLLLILLLFWGIRLTANWARGFAGLHAQDWRYTDVERQHPRLWPLISLVGIQMTPTIVVFLAMLPALYAVVQPTGLHIWTLPVALFAVAGVCLEWAADGQMRRFRRDGGNNGQVNARGLWRLSRHPNYLGEIAFWWGVYLTSLSTARLPPWTLTGPAAVTALFLFVSIPMMEKRQLSAKPGYREYMKATGMLIPRVRRG